PKKDASNATKLPPADLQPADDDAKYTASPASELSKDASPSDMATRGGQKKRNLDQKQIVIMAAGGIIVAILAFVLVSIPHKQRPPKLRNTPITQQQDASNAAGATSGKSSVPVTESASVHETGDHNQL